MDGGTTSVLVADGRQMVAETLQRAIDAEPDLRVVGALTNRAELLDVTAQRAPDVVVLGCDFGGDGVTAVRRLREERPATQIVMLLDDLSGASARAAIVAGCLGVISKDRGTDDLCNAIRSAARGRAVAAVSDLDGLFSTPTPVDESERRGGLTGRQYEVLLLMAEGCATDDLAARLYVSKNTVRTHVQQVFRKLGARSRLEAVAIARRSGVLT
jgi:DNA-binding NarL/FixJ family response regulator